MTNNDSSPSARRETTRGSEVARTDDLPHVLVITGDPTQPSRKWTYTVECPGVTEKCRLYEECEPCNALDGEQAEALEENQYAHGQDHTWTTVGWGTPTDDCLLQRDEGLWDAGTDLVSDEAIPHPGRYPVHFFYDGDLVVLELAGEVDRG